MTNTTASDHLSRRRKLLFSTGDLSTSIPLANPDVLPALLPDRCRRLTPGVCGLGGGQGRIWDAINDPLFGLISDRIRTRWGRRRVLLLFGAVPLGLTFMLMWLVPPLGQLGLTLYYATVFILFDTVFTLVHVGYNTLTPEMTSDYDERSSSTATGWLSRSPAPWARSSWRPCSVGQSTTSACASPSPA